MNFWLLLVATATIIGLSACGEGTNEADREINPTPTKQDGAPSYEFEEEDIKRAEEAPQAVQEYCEGAVSEAQEVGCLSHVEESEVP